MKALKKAHVKEIEAKVSAAVAVSSSSSSTAQGLELALSACRDECKTLQHQVNSLERAVDTANKKAQKAEAGKTTSEAEAAK